LATDHDYDNRKAVQNAELIINEWALAARRFRYDGNMVGRYNLSYGDHPREIYDHFRPPPPTLGTVIFVHGGNWRALDKNHFSHVALPFLLRGLEVIILNYPLAPETQLPNITASITKALNHILPNQPDPVHLIGHSAGAHLVTRQICNDIWPLLTHGGKIKSVHGLSGIYDLSPLCDLSLNQALKLTKAIAKSESPIHSKAAVNLRCKVGVGDDELPA